MGTIGDKDGTGNFVKTRVRRKFCLAPKVSFAFCFRCIYFSFSVSVVVFLVMVICSSFCSAPEVLIAPKVSFASCFRKY